MIPINKNEKLQDPVDLIAKLKPMKAKRSKDDVWAELQEMLEKPSPLQNRIHPLFAKKWQIAASVAVILTLSVLATLRFYTKTVSCLSGAQQTATLPDGSVVELNAKSQISFHPLWWKINRAVNLEGEAFFKVKKGEKFTVVSKNGETWVMGTSFNIFARDKEYEVTCLTGKVRVLSRLTNYEVIITPNQMVTLNNSGKLNAKVTVNAKLAIDWTQGKFVFTQVPLNKVLSEISRRYNVEIMNNENLNQLYTGSFNKDVQIDDVLNLVCKPFDIEYEKSPSGAYIIQQP